MNALQSLKHAAATTGRTLAWAAVPAAALLGGPSAQAASVEVTVENLTAEGGVFLTPVFVGFHAGTADLYDSASAVTPGFERLAEDGSTQFLNDEFQAGSSSRVSGALPGGFGTFPPPAVLGPGQTSSATFEVDPVENRYLSYVSMVIPSNDAFVGNDTPTAIELFDDDGNFQTTTFVILGSSVRDAGTELNNEVDVAFLDQTVADAGTPTDEVVRFHPGLNGSFDNPDGTPINILGGTNGLGFNFDPTAADFSLPGYEIARVTVTSFGEGTPPNVIPAPATLPAGLALMALLLTFRHRRPEAVGVLA